MAIVVFYQLLRQVVQNPELVESGVCLHWAWERCVAVHNGLTAFSGPSDQLFQEVVDLLDESEYSFKGLLEASSEGVKFGETNRKIVPLSTINRR